MSQQDGSPAAEQAAPHAAPEPSGRPLLTLKNGWLVIALGLWLMASFAGTVAESLPRQVFFVTQGGEGVGACQDYFPEAVAEGRAQPFDYCTRDSVLGGSLPEDVRTSTGGISFDSVSLTHLGEAALKPDLWLTIGVGGVALILLFVFARATGTLRAGLAVSISSVFLGLLLFPTSITWRIPQDMRSELVVAWQWIIMFYFGSEAAVQAWKVSHRTGTGIPGDMPPER